MTDTSSTLSNPKDKSFDENIGSCENNQLCDKLVYNTLKTTPEKFRKLADEEELWTGESTQCGGCNHHVEQHCTRNHFNDTVNRHCHGSNELCNCKFFMARSVRLSHSNCYKMVTEA